MKRYKIVITEIGEERRTIGKEWARGAHPDDPAAFGYTPETVATRPYEREVYTQNVADMDMIAVIKAVNGVA